MSLWREGSSPSLGTTYNYKKKMEKNLQKVKALQDESGHWYVIPIELVEEFYKFIEDENNYDSKWDKYMTGGDLNCIQLWAEIEE